MTKIIPPVEFPSEDDVQKAVELIVPPEWQREKVFTVPMMQEIQKTARQIMMKRKTIQ